MNLGENMIQNSRINQQFNAGFRVLALRMAPDEHAQHKDVYAHSLTVLRQAGISGKI